MGYASKGVVDKEEREMFDGKVGGKCRKRKNKGVVDGGPGPH